ncbi:MAG: C45 family peptidase [Actinomycetota bacterium]
MHTRGPIRIFDAGGAPADVGRAHGTAFADDINRYVRERVDLITAGRWNGGPLDETDVLAIAESMIPAHAAFDPALHDEMEAMADAAGISTAEAIIVGGFTDFVDTVAAVSGGPPPTTVIEDDCTAVLVPDSCADGAGFFAQTWDMHDTATEHVILLRVRPHDAPPARIFTTTGCLGQIGMNDDGLCVGINNLTGRDGCTGVTWPSVVRGMLKCTDAQSALDVLLDADLAGAHNFLILDRHGVGYNVEAMPSTRPVSRLGDAPIAHTNHVLDASARHVEVRADTGLHDNSTARLQAARRLIEHGTVDAERLFALTREPDAICQTAVAPYFIESSGAAVMRPRTRDFWACWGRPINNEFTPIAAASPRPLAGRQTG